MSSPPTGEPPLPNCSNAHSGQILLNDSVPPSYSADRAAEGGGGAVSRGSWVSQSTASTTAATAVTATVTAAATVTSDLCVNLTPLPSSRRRSRDSQGYSLLSADSAAPCLPPEAEEELTISPYACYDASLGDTAPPIISGWLDKLSPQGCV